MKREHLGMVLVVVLSLVLLTGFITIISNTAWRKDHDGDENREDEIEPQFINVSMKDIYLTDRTTTRSFDETLMTDWLVCWVDITNEGEMDYNFTSTPVKLVTGGGEHFSHVEVQFFSEILPQNGTIAPGGTAGGWLHYRIPKGEQPLKLVAQDFFFGHFRGELDIAGIPLEFRTWRTPLDLKIDRCGRDGRGEPHPGIFFMNISVENTGKNASMFEDWHLRLNVTGGNVRDVMFGQHRNWTWIFPGETYRYKLYFDIRMDHPEEPETLYDLLNWIFVEIDPSVYEDYV
ncbi:MAG: DUF4352 domain-containing protein [Thermoplasmatota archaeon]